MFVAPSNAPRNLRASNKTTANRANASVTLTWIPPLTPNGKIFRYNVEVFLANTNRTVVSSTSIDTTLIIDSKLEKFTWYEARVQAETIGPGPFSNRIRFLTDEDGKSAV